MLQKQLAALCNYLANYNTHQLSLHNFLFESDHLVLSHEVNMDNTIFHLLHRVCTKTRVPPHTGLWLKDSQHKKKK